MAVTLISLDRDVLIAGGHPLARSENLTLCAECRYAKTFGEHLRAYCGHASGLRAGQCVFAGQPACSSFKARPAA